MIQGKDLWQFVTESNLIEGITRPATPAEIDVHAKFLFLPELTVADVENLVSVVQPGAKLRIRTGNDVAIGSHRPPRGGPHIRSNLEMILREMQCDPDDFTPFDIHAQYESLHPFMDGNGRSGRAIWMWHMENMLKDHSWLRLGFLHLWYYQSLQEAQL